MDHYGCVVLRKTVCLFTQSKIKSLNFDYLGLLFDLRLVSQI